MQKVTIKKDTPEYFKHREELDKFEAEFERLDNLFTEALDEFYPDNPTALERDEQYLIERLHNLSTVAKNLAEFKKNFPQIHYYYVD